MKSRNLVLLLAITFIGGGFHPNYNIVGTYYPTIDQYWCTTDWACIHEVGHKLDYRNERVSQSDAFKKAIDNFGDVYTYALDGIKWAYHIRAYTYPTKERTSLWYSEIYADIFLWADGRQENMPLELVRFYNWDSAAVYLRNVKHIVETSKALE